MTPERNGVTGATKEPMEEDAGPGESPAVHRTSVPGHGTVSHSQSETGVSTKHRATPTVL